MFNEAMDWSEFKKEIALFDLNDLAIERLKKYHDMIIEKSKVMNLLSAKGLENILSDHFYDSLVAVPTFKKVIDEHKYESIADMGSGNGFPGVVLQIVFPDKKVFLLESIKKKADFLKEVYVVLGFDPGLVICERIEQLYKNQKYKNKLDIVTARGLGQLKMLIEYAAPILKNGGQMLFYKSQELERELVDAQPVIKKLGLKTAPVIDVSHHGKIRSLFVLINTEHTKAR